MKLNKYLFNPKIFGIGSDELSDKMIQIIFNNSRESFSKIGSEEFYFNRLNNNTVIFKNKIFSDQEVFLNAYDKIKEMYHTEIEFLSCDLNNSKKNLRFNIKFIYEQDANLWIIDNYYRFRGIESSILEKGDYRTYVFDLLGFKILLKFNSNSKNNGKYIEKANKCINLHQQIEYIRFLLNEELLIIG